MRKVTAAVTQMGCSQDREENLQKAEGLVRQAAEQGYAYAQCNLGYCYLSGIGTQADAKEAVIWFRKAADQGHARGQRLLGQYEAYAQAVQEFAGQAFTRFFPEEPSAPPAEGQGPAERAQEKEETA